LSVFFFWDISNLKIFYAGNLLLSFGTEDVEGGQKNIYKPNTLAELKSDLNRLE